MNDIIIDTLKSLEKSGKFFTISFMKKDGSERILTGRFGVKKHLHDGKATVDVNKYYIVYDIINKGYRAVNRNTINWIKCNNKIIYNNI